MASLFAGGMITKSMDFLTPIFEASGGTSWAASMQYKCNKCCTKCKGNDGRMLHALPPHYRMAYPVNPGFAVHKLLHLLRPLSHTVQKLMVTHGNGEQLAKMIHQTQGERYKDIEESYYSQCVDTGSCAGRLPTFTNWIGTYSPTAHKSRLLYTRRWRNDYWNKRQQLA
jgi:hypothetical protein